MLKTKIFAVILILAIACSVLPLFAQSDIVQITHTITFVEAEARPESPGKAKPTPVSPDYKLIINRGKTAIPVTLTVYTENNEGIDAIAFETAISYAAQEWDRHTGANLLGVIVPKSSSAVYGLDDINAIFFANLDTGIIAMASIWYNRATKEIVECDIRFNTDFTWSTTTTTTVMDVQNIATHELGHFFNLADIYDETKIELTMYGRSWNGDTTKRDLAQGDIDGIQAVFGP